MRNLKSWMQISFFLVFASCLSFTQEATNGLDPSFSVIDNIVRDVLANTSVPSASIAIVKSGRLAYAQAYGNACLDPLTPARADMSYSIGSISKQFTAAAILILAEQHKLSLDDPVARFFPTLYRAKEITIRELLSHTSGYQDYWPQDYLPPFMLVPVTEDQILDRWASKALDYDPGTQWQYSNTGFVIAGLIVQKVSGMPLIDFLHKYVFMPLDMQNVANVDQGRADATGYVRYALGPSRPAPKEGKGWLFGAAELGMPARELAKWDIAMIRQTLLKPSSYREMETEVLLTNGLGAHYGLGIGVKMEADHRALEHGGEISGFTAENWVFPDDGMAVVVLTNQDPANAAPDIARRISTALFSGDRATRERKQQQARQIFVNLQKGEIERSLFTANANSYFTSQAVKDFASSLGPLGAPEEFVQASHEDRGGMSFRSYRVKYPDRTLDVWVREMPDGKIEQYQVKAE
ncbi:MAG TPA: serine hydrolase domain-containing protein [Blastocatellia bacterium]|nr:serine hydrolase domain-containing protein [Blastocatellia bacterium]